MLQRDLIFVPMHCSNYVTCSIMCSMYDPSTSTYFSPAPRSFAQMIQRDNEKAHHLRSGSIYRRRICFHLHRKANSNRQTKRRRRRRRLLQTVTFVGSRVWRTRRRRPPTIIIIVTHTLGRYIQYSALGTRQTVQLYAKPHRKQGDSITITCSQVSIPCESLNAIAFVISTRTLPGI